jgi:hypothetical protein
MFEECMGEIRRARLKWAYLGVVWAEAVLDFNRAEKLSGTPKVERVRRRALKEYRAAVDWIKESA